jgi:uncharacterized iron-regulated membrane protein
LGLSERTSDAGKPNSRFVARMIESHSILGLAFAALIYIVSLTGAFTVFVEEVALWENANAPTASRVAAETYETAIENAYARRLPDGKVENLVAYGPTGFAPVLLLRLNEENAGGEHHQSNWIADPRTGELLDELNDPLAQLIEELHVALHLPSPWGRYLVGLLGVCMFTLIISGIMAHPSIFRDAFKLRLDRNRRSAWTDLHNRLSVWGLPYHLVLTFTGGFLGLAGLIVGAVALLAYEGDQEAALASIEGPQPVASAPMTGLPPIAEMVATARADGRDIELLVVGQPGDSGGISQVGMEDPSILDGRQALIFRNSGEFIETYGGTGAPAGIRALAMLQPLHYGTFGGYPVKILYFVMALALTWVTSSGMQIWFARRSQQGRPVPRLQSAWLGMTAGLSLGLAAATLLAALGAGAKILLALLAIWIATIAFFLARRDKNAGDYRMFAFAMAALLSAAVVANLAAPNSLHPVIIGMNALILLVAACFVGFALRTRKSVEGVNMQSPIARDPA